jgi:hypothetical protein
MRDPYQTCVNLPTVTQVAIAFSSRSTIGCGLVIGPVKALVAWRTRLLECGNRDGGSVL